MCPKYHGRKWTTGAGRDHYVVVARSCRNVLPAKPALFHILFVVPKRIWLACILALSDTQMLRIGEGEVGQMMSLESCASAHVIAIHYL